MPNTRKKVIKTVYKDDESSENEGDDFSDSGSEAVISDHESSDDEEECHQSSEDDFQSKQPKPKRQNVKKPKTKFTKSFINKISKQDVEFTENTPLFSVKDMTDADKLLPPVLNLSESDSSDDDAPRITKKNKQPSSVNTETIDCENEAETKFEYKDVWSENVHDNSEEIAKKTFMELEKHKNKIEETKQSIQTYTLKNDIADESEVKDLLALGEDEKPTKSKKKAITADSDSEMEDWEEVNESKGIPQQGLQLIVGIPDGVCRKSKKIDIEMMMKRKMNRVKKEYQVYMHKVHVLCWIGHGNYVSQVLNDQDILAASLSLVPSKECYPGERVDMKYVEQITNWYKEKVTLKQDKHENKFRPKAPSLKELLLQQIKSRIFSTKKYIVFVFVSMLRSLGLQSRVMFNFVTLPIRPPPSELCSLSTKEKDTKSGEKEVKGKRVKKSAPQKAAKVKKEKIDQLDGNCDSSNESDSIMQIDGNDDNPIVKTRRQKNVAASSTGKHLNTDNNAEEESLSPPKRARTRAANKQEKETAKVKSETNQQVDSEKLDKTRGNTRGTTKNMRKSLSLKVQENIKVPVNDESKIDIKIAKDVKSPRKTRSKDTDKKSLETQTTAANIAVVKEKQGKNKSNPPKIVVSSNHDNDNISSKYFEDDKSLLETKQPGRKRSRTSEAKASTTKNCDGVKKQRTRSAHNIPDNKSKYFSDNNEPVKNTRSTRGKLDNKSENQNRISHRDIGKPKTISKNDVTGDLVNIIKERVKEAKHEAKKRIVKEKIKQESDEDSDYLPVESPKRNHSESDDDFKPVKISPKPNTVKKIDRRVLSTDDELPLNKIDVWCEVFVEELEEWVAVDIIRGKVHCVNEIYNRATHPVNYVIGWDDNNYLKDLTRRYVPHWNTVTRKQRVNTVWWEQAIKAWLGPKTAKDREEDERLDRMQLDAPLPKSIAEYKNHPLYALKRHLLKFEALYPPDAATLGFVRGEAVYARDCVYVCRSRDTWLKEAKVVKLGEQPYKVVKARPKWDKLSNKLITDKPLEIFGPWQVQDYEPPVAENGVVPRNPYGNVELFKECMLPKGTVHVKLPGLNRIAKKLNIDCAPAMTGFEFNGGWSHPVYDGFVVCEEFEQVITEAWLKDQEEQERKEIEKTEARVYGNWRKLIRGLLIKERLQAKYGFEEPSTSKDKKAKGPRLVVKKK